MMMMLVVVELTVRQHAAIYTDLHAAGSPQTDFPVSAQLYLSVLQQPHNNNNNNNIYGDVIAR